MMAKDGALKLGDRVRITVKSQYNDRLGTIIRLAVWGYSVKLDDMIYPLGFTDVEVAKEE